MTRVPFSAETAQKQQVESTVRSRKRSFKDIKLLPESVEDRATEKTAETPQLFRVLELGTPHFEEIEKNHQLENVRHVVPNCKCLPAWTCVWFETSRVPRSVADALPQERILCFDNMTKQLAYTAVSKMCQVVPASVGISRVSVACQNGSEVNLPADYPVPVEANHGGYDGLSYKAREYVQAQHLRSGRDKVIINNDYSVPVEISSYRLDTTVTHHSGCLRSKWLSITIEEPRRYEIVVASSIMDQVFDVHCCTKSTFLHFLPEHSPTSRRASSAPPAVYREGSYLIGGNSDRYESSSARSGFTGNSGEFRRSISHLSHDDSESRSDTTMLTSSSANRLIWVPSRGHQPDAALWYKPDDAPSVSSFCSSQLSDGATSEDEKVTIKVGQVLSGGKVLSGVKSNRTLSMARLSDIIGMKTGGISSIGSSHDPKQPSQCVPCSFHFSRLRNPERTPCKASFLCEFCHFEHPRTKRRVQSTVTAKFKPWRREKKGQSVLLPAGALASPVE